MVPDILEENFWADTPQMNREVPCAGRCKKERILFVSFFAPKERRAEKNTGRKPWNIRAAMQKEKSKGGKRMVSVEWENANELELGELMEMAEDGYWFGISDGKIRSIGVAVNVPS